MEQVEKIVMKEPLTSALGQQITITAKSMKPVEKQPDGRNSDIHAYPANIKIDRNITVQGTNPNTTKGKR